MAVLESPDNDGATGETPKRISILGSTGSIGVSTLDLVQRHAEQFQVEALVANRNVAKLSEQARAVNASVAVVADDTCYADLKNALAGTDIAVAAGTEAVIEAAARDAEWVMSAIVGAAGLAPTLAAVRRGATVGLANKETLVCAGDLFLSELRKHGATLLPVDSEHNAIFQVLDTSQRDAVEKLVLTASGGPFRQATLDTMRAATPAQAVAHPNWSMGAKISVDSATMINKGLELIEASYLFSMPEAEIDVLVHPQSIIHSMVAYNDGSVLAQLGTPDMRTPIAYCLAWPSRMSAPSARLDLAEIATLTFEKPDLQRFRGLALAREALRSGGGTPTLFNAANEVAVAAFLAERIGFLDIARIVDHVMETCPGPTLTDLDAVDALDAEARRVATVEVDRLG